MYFNLQFFHETLHSIVSRIDVQSLQTFFPRADDVINPALRKRVWFTGLANVSQT